MGLRNLIQKVARASNFEYGRPSFDAKPTAKSSKEKKRKEKPKPTEKANPAIKS